MPSLASSCCVVLLATLAAPIYYNYFPAQKYTIEKKCAVVTGASEGIGVHIAEYLAAGGVDRLVIAARRKEKLESVAADITKKHSGTKVFPLVLDMNSKDSRSTFVKELAEQVGPCEILVNNAGMEKNSFAESYSDETLDNVLGLNLINTIKLTRDLMPQMLKAGQGHIVMVASLAGKTGIPYNAAYSASKHGILGFTASIRSELRLEGKPITAGAVLPGFVRGDGMAADAVRALGFDWAALEANLGASDPQDTAAAVIRAIERDEPEIQVNNIPLRPLFALNGLFPRLVDGFNDLSVATGRDLHFKLWRTAAEKNLK